MPKIFEFLESYSAISPSGTGLRIIVKAQLPPDGRKNEGIEVYQDGRFLTITGHWFNHGLLLIASRRDTVNAIHAKIFGNGYKSGSEKKRAP
ncbi:MAG: hypothetical protein R6U19_01750 [Bacteroidales bacterium]